MQIEILGCESFGARSFACVVNTDERKIVIDPGVALARLRSGLSPSPGGSCCCCEDKGKGSFCT